MRRLRVELPGVPIVVIAGDERTPAERAAMDAGAHDFIRKAELRSSLLPRVIGFAVERERLRKLELHLEASMRLATMGQVAASVAHEVNNPAAYVLANLELLSDHLAKIQAIHGSADAGISKLDAEARDLLDAALDGIQRIGGIVRELKSLSSSKPDEPEAVDVNEIVEAACAMVQGGARRRATLELELGEVPNIAGSRGKLVQLVTNLVVNAFEACPGSDHVVAVRTRLRDAQVWITVEDDGLGIPQEVRPRVFEPLFTTKAVEGGTGLGLGICRRIVKEHRGTISVTSEVGVGTSFAVAFPTDATVRQPAVRRPRAAQATVGRLRLLLVDDEAALRSAYARKFSAKHDIVVAQDGVEALEALDEDPSFDAILCDLSMPRMDGIEFYENLRIRHPTLREKVAFCTGGATDERTKSFLEREAPLVLEKPLSLREILSAVEGLVSSPHRVEGGS